MKALPLLVKIYDADADAGGTTIAVRIISPGELNKKPVYRQYLVHNPYEFSGSYAKCQGHSET